jgi:hypothetical protein
MALSQENPLGQEEAFVTLNDGTRIRAVFAIPGDDDGAVVEDTPWTSSGLLSLSSVVSTAPCVLGEVRVTASDNGGDINLIVWDSSDATPAAHTALCRVTITTTTASVQEVFMAPSGAGVNAANGLFVQIVAGDCEYVVYYR